MKLASYRTLWGAKRYAQELAQRFPHLQFDLVIDSSFQWSIQAISSDGTRSAVAKRPRGFGKTAPEAAIAQWATAIANPPPPKEP